MTTELQTILTRLETLRADIRAIALAAQNKRDHDTATELAEVDHKLESAEDYITDFVLPYLK